MKDISLKTIALYVLEFFVVATVVTILVNSYLSFPKALEEKRLTENKVSELSTELEEKNNQSYQLADNNDLMSQQLENESQILEKIKLINSNYVRVDVEVIESVSSTIDTVKVTLKGDIDLGYDALESILNQGKAISSCSLIGTDNPELSVIFNVKK